MNLAVGHNPETLVKTKLAGKCESRIIGLMFVVLIHPHVSTG